MSPDVFVTYLPGRSQRAQVANVVAACGGFRRIELAAQSDLSRGTAHAAGSSVESNQRGESTLARRQIDAAGISAKQLVTAF